MSNFLPVRSFHSLFEISFSAFRLTSTAFQDFSVASFILSNFDDLVNDGTSDEYEDYNTINSGSTNENFLDIISSSMFNKDVNLNIDFSKFDNHVFFGSAVSN